VRLCLVGHSAEGLVGNSPGGAETQLALLATHLARRGNHVTLVATGYGGEEGQFHGVELRSGWDDARGIRFVRAATYRYPRLQRVLVDARAEAYYVRGVSLAGPTVVSAARRVDAVSLLALCSDRDGFADSARYQFGLGGPLIAGITGRLGYEYFRRRALERVDCVVVQNRTQARACAEAGRPHHIVPSVVPPLTDRLYEVSPSVDAVWVGNVRYSHRRPKGVGELAELARRLPRVSFSIVGRLDAPQVQGVVERLHRLPNVTLCGFLEHEKTLERIAAARVILNTSPSEGFSNVMLEGWALRKPTVSLSVDPNGLLTGGGLGLCAAGRLDVMASSLESLLADEGLRVSMGDSAYEYVTGVHGPGAVCERLEGLAMRLTTKR
jgi:glycosyltransferase involved in cell wall biosynthesis